MADGDEGWQRVADHRETNGPKPGAWQRGQLKRQGDDVPPATLPQRSAQGAEHEDGHGEGLVLTVAGGDSARYRGRIQRAHLSGEPGIRTGDRRRLPSRWERGLSCLLCGCRIFDTGKVQRTPAQQRGGKVAFADGGVSPATVRILVLTQPGRAFADACCMLAAVHKKKRHDGRGRG